MSGQLMYLGLLHRHSSTAPRCLLCTRPRVRNNPRPERGTTRKLTKFKYVPRGASLIGTSHLSRGLPTLQSPWPLLNVLFSLSKVMNGLRASPVISPQYFCLNVAVNLEPEELSGSCYCQGAELNCYSKEERLTSAVKSPQEVD